MRWANGAVIMLAMDTKRPADLPEPIRLTIELERPAQPPRGRLLVEGADARPFEGWLELVSWIDSELEAADSG